MNATFERLADIAAEHGHQAWVTPEGVAVGIGWSNVHTGETGTEYSTVQTFRQLRDVLGY